jgi:hypothetical protein
MKIREENGNAAQIGKRAGMRSQDALGDAIKECVRGIQTRLFQ